nr:hypothetical protein [Sinorhizobium sp. M103]
MAPAATRTAARQATSSGGGGSGGSISITNTGQVNLGSATNPLNGLDYVWGLAAQSIGQAGGHDNGAGGAGGAIRITNGSTGGNASVGAINIYSNSADSVRGIYAFSQGSYGTASQDSSDNGGAGADGDQFSIDTYSDITVVATGSGPNDLSGGIVAISQGGDGGAGTKSTTGGRGGNGSAFNSTLSVQSGVTVSTKGDYVAGVVGLAQGGRGGDGASGEKDSSGGKGGDVGEIQINVYGGSIETDGLEAYGLLGEASAVREAMAATTRPLSERAAAAATVAMPAVSARMSLLAPGSRRQGTFRLRSPCIRSAAAAARAAISPTCSAAVPAMAAMAAMAIRPPSTMLAGRSTPRATIPMASWYSRSAAAAAPAASPTG